MDEAELEVLFRQAAEDGPEPSFDADDVRRGSRRVTARRRTALAGGTLVAAALLVGGVGFGTGALQPGDSTIAEAPHPAAQPPQLRNPVAPQSPMAPQNPMALPPAAQPEPEQSPMALPQAPASPRSGMPRTLDDTRGSECGAPDSAVAGALTQELPEAAHTSPIGAPPPCPAGARGAAVTLREGESNGKIAVLITPPGANAAENRPHGTAVAQAQARSGATITVLSQPVGSGRAPFAERLDALAQRLAPRF